MFGFMKEAVNTKNNLLKELIKKSSPSHGQVVGVSVEMFMCDYFM